MDIFIVKHADILVIPLCLLYRRSLNEGIVPSIWLSAFITPVHKKGEKLRIENCRPSFKLRLFAKILRIYSKVYAVLNTTFDEHQHGFLKSRSTVSNLGIVNE